MITSHIPSRTRAARAAFVALVAGAVVIGAPDATPAHAAPIVNVTNVLDSAAGSCKTTGTGACTLREAIIFANHNPGTTINIPAGNYELTVMGQFENEAVAGDLDILRDTKLIGAGSDVAAISVGGTGVDPDRVFDIAPAVGVTSIDVSISGLSLQSGVANDGFGGGGMWVGAGAHVTVADSQLLGNHSTTSGGAIAVIGGGTAKPTSLTVVNSSIGRNSVSDGSFAPSGGGGIYASAATLTVVNSLIGANDAHGSDGTGGAVPIHGSLSTGGGILAEARSVVSIVGSAIGGNTVSGGDGDPAASANEGRQAGSGGGGGVAIAGATTLTMVNSTVASNTAAGGRSGAGQINGSGVGGGIFALEANVILANDTIVDNVATGGSSELGGSGGFGSGGGVAVGALGRITNSIVARNSINPVAPAAGTDIHDAFASGGHNLVGIADGITGFVGSDLTGSTATPLDAKVALEFVDNGGQTPTLALLPGSPAINAGDNAVCAAPLPPTAGPNGAGNIDQRGLARPQPTGGACDIGAFEHVFVPTTTALSSSANPTAVGHAITFTATVAATGGGTPTGTVTLRDGATSLGTGTLAGGAAAVTTVALGPGTHSITATYEGDALFAPSTGAINQVVAPGSGGPGLQFYPLPRPVRLLDTRPAHSAFVQPGVALTANQTLTLPGRFSVGSITVPPEAQALVGNATVDNTASVPPGFATLWPSGSELPLASNLNFVQGTVRPNAFTVGLGSDGKFNLLSNTGGHFIIDITGYYAPPATSGLFFHPLAQPVRLLDTRVGADAVVHPGTPLSAGQTLAVNGRFTSKGTTVPASAKALAGNATVDNTVNVPPGFATLFPGGTDLPPTSNLNFAAGTIAPNAFTVGLGSDGTFQLYSNTGGNFIIDVTGYYDDVPTGGLLYHPLTQPVRELDTRTGHSAAVHPDAPLTPGGTLTLPGAFSFNNIVVPSGATALLGNATVDNSVNAPAGFATLHPAGAPLPLASNLNYQPGLVAPNAFIVGIGAGNSYNLFSQSGSNFIIDISGYFAPT